MYCRLLLKLILRDKAVWICTLVLAAAFSVPIAFNSPIYGPFFMKQGMQGFVDAFNTRAPQASGTDLSPEQQDDAELARYANAALAAQTDAAFLDSAESYYALMDEGFQSGSIVGDRETNDAALAYCRALSSSGIADIPASASDLPFLSFLPYAIATAPSFLPFIPFLLSSILLLGATRPATLAAKAPVPKFRRLIQTVFSIIVAGTAMLLAGLAPGGIYALALNGFGQIGYPIAFFHDGALTTTTAGNVFTALLLALLAGGTLISVCSAVLSTATRRVLAGPLTSALLVAAPAFPLLSDSALGHNAALELLPLAVFSPIEATGYVGCFPTEFIQAAHLCLPWPWHTSRSFSRSAPLRRVRPNRLDPLKSTMGSSSWTRAWDTGARRYFRSDRFPWARERRRGSSLPTARGKPPFLKRCRANFPPASAREAWRQTESANVDQPNLQNSST